MYDSDDRVEKWEVEAEITLVDGTTLLGHLFVTPTSRVSDLLNDPREFMPLRMSDGRIEHVRKDTVTRVSELDVEIKSDKIKDPYEFLGIKPAMDDEELRITYHHLCMMNHPDKLQAIDVAPEIVAFANTRLRRIIDAYNQIMAKRHGTRDAAKTAEPPPEGYQQSTG